MKSNHTDNAMEKKAPALSLTLSPAFMLETPINLSPAPSNQPQQTEDFVSIVIVSGIEFLSSLFLKHQDC